MVQFAEVVAVGPFRDRLRKPMGIRPFTSIAAVASLLMLVGACQGGVGSVPVSSWSGPKLSTGGLTSWSLNGIPAVGPSNHADIGEIFLCLSAPGRAVITDVQPVRPIGTVEVVAFAVRPNPVLSGGVMLGSGAGTLQQNGFDTADRTVDTQCVTGTGRGYELGLELTVPPGMSAGTKQFQIDYAVGDHTASLLYPVGVVLCSAPTVKDASCASVFRQLGLSTGA